MFNKKGLNSFFYEQNDLQAEPLLGVLATYGFNFLVSDSYAFQENPGRKFYCEAISCLCQLKSASQRI